MRQIVVPLDSAAMKRLDYDEAGDAELRTLELGDAAYDALWQCGIVEKLNDTLGTVIDDYEDESIEGEPSLQAAVSLVEDELESHPDCAPLRRLRELIGLALEKKTGIFFYF